MAKGQPFMYDAVSSQDHSLPYKPFDPRPYTRASNVQNQHRPYATNNTGSLVSFNVHPDAWGTSPSTSHNVIPMSSSTKTKVVTMRWLQFALRVLELFGALGTLAVFIMISEIPAVIGWVLRIPAAVAILHAAYAIYHLSRTVSARTPASTASYMGFAAAFDATLLCFYAFSAYMSIVQYKDFKISSTLAGEWSTILPQGTSVMPVLTGAVSLSTIITGALHLISLVISTYLCILFRQISNLPPDMNPLEPKLTARSHKRNKSSISMAEAPQDSLKDYETRIRIPLESRRNSGTPYDTNIDARSPTVPFLHTHSGSHESIHTNHTRDSRADLPTRQYQIMPANVSKENLAVKRKPVNTNEGIRSTIKDSSDHTYTEIDLNEDKPRMAPMKEAWFNTKETKSRPISSAYPKIGLPKQRYAPLQQNAVDSAEPATTEKRQDEEAIRGLDLPPLLRTPSPPPRSPKRNSYMAFPQSTPRSSYHAPAEAPTPPPHVTICRPESPAQATHFDSPKSFIPQIQTRNGSPRSFVSAGNNGSRNTTPTKLLPNPFTKSRILTNIPLSNTSHNARKSSSSYSGDLVDASTSDVSSVSSYNRNPEYTYKGSPPKSTVQDRIDAFNTKNARKDANDSSDDERPTSNRGYRRQRAHTNTTNASAKTFSFTADSEILNASDQVRDKFMTKSYGKLHPATPPTPVHTIRDSWDLGERAPRQVSSGFEHNPNKNNIARGRDVSGKVAEEGRGSGGWAARYRHSSGYGIGDA